MITTTTISVSANATPIAKQNAATTATGNQTTTTTIRTTTKNDDDDDDDDLFIFNYVSDDTNKLALALV